MKKLLIGLGLAALTCGCGSGNMDMNNTNHTFNKAVIRWPDGTVKEIKIKQWTDYLGGKVQIIAKDGTIYFISMHNTVLVSDPD